MKRRAALSALLMILCVCALVCGCTLGAAVHASPRTTHAPTETPAPVEMLEAPQIAAALSAVRALLAENDREP